MQEPVPSPEARRRDRHQGGEIQVESCLTKGQTDPRVTACLSKREMGRSLLCRHPLNAITDVAGEKVGQTTTKSYCLGG
jgi:hypothetical protein